MADYITETCLLVSYRLLCRNRNF